LSVIRPNPMIGTVAIVALHARASKWGSGVRSKRAAKRRAGVALKRFGSFGLVFAGYPQHAANSSPFD